MPNFVWHSVQELPPRQFTCGHCGKLVGTNKGYRGDVDNQAHTACVYVCSYCEEPTYIRDDRQVPGVAYGNKVESLPSDIEKLYEEARQAFSVSAYTASVLTCRKILMNIAVAQGAAEGLRFVEYVEHLAANGYVPPHGEGWVDHIRRKGNEANHEIELMAMEDARDLISFVEMLLKFIYEFPARVPTTP
jgi:hypothetical protein